MDASAWENIPDIGDYTAKRRKEERFVPVPDNMLARAAGYLEREIDNFSSTALSLLEPLIIVALGGLVAVVILAILLPILQLQNLAGL